MTPSSNSGTSSPVRIPLTSLLSDPSSHQDDIARAFGSEAGCLGVILISDLPKEYAELRRKLFHLIYKFANLPDDTRESLAREEDLYSFGWSHGKEVMNGKPDTQKGSYYANPLIDRPDVDEEKRRAHPEYYTGNTWPTDIGGMEEFETTFKTLGKLIYEAGLALAKACEPFIASTSKSSSSSSAAVRTVEDLISHSQANKARLLHYYPLPEDEAAAVNGEGNGQDGDQLDSFCGTHIDHSLLTGLCSAMYLSPPPPPSSSSSSSSSSAPTETTSPDPWAGLHIYPRKTKAAVQIKIPVDCLAFQIGEALQLLTAGKLCATPHFVSGSKVGGGQVSRETFAFFLQPDVDDIVSPDGETFGAFTKRVLARHYT